MVLGLLTKSRFLIPARVAGVSALLLACLLWLPGEGLVAAQSATIAWSKPLNISNTPQNSVYPTVVTDSYGYIHVFWGEDVGGRALGPQDSTNVSNSIFYTRWDGNFWTTPTDVLSAPDDPVADFVAVAVDAKNRLHAVWSGQTAYYYSNAPSTAAFSGHAWSEPIVIAQDSARSSWPISIAIDARGTLHVIYATRGDDAGVYYTWSGDGGANWQPEIKLSDPLGPSEFSFGNLRIITDQAGRLHAIWQTSQSEGFGQAIYYTRSVDGGANWDAPLQLGYRQPGDFDVGWPYLVARGESELHLIYNAGPTHAGRYHRISRDGGRTWTEPNLIIPDMEGINGYNVLIVDGAGQLHLIIDMRTRSTQAVGIYYASWLETEWSPVVPLATDGLFAYSAHYTAAAVRLGNELHVVWNQISGGEIWYLRGVIPGVIPAPARPVQPLSTPTVQPTPTRILQTTPVSPQPIGRSVSPVPAIPSSRIMARTSFFSIGIPALAVLVIVGLILVSARQKQ